MADSFCLKNYPKRSRTRRVLVFHGAGAGADKDFAIDEADFLAVRELLFGTGIREDEIPRRVREMVEISKDNHERRVLGLYLGYSKIASLPPSIGQLNNLTDLVLSYSKIASLPPSIGQMQSLNHLDLTNTTDLLHLPEEIGNLIDLKHLYLMRSSVTSLPSSIGQLNNLTDLNLDDSKIASIPPSIGQLQSLFLLSLIGTTDLLQLPKEIGNLTKLVDFDLGGSAIKKLPEEIGKLTNLRVLRLPNSGIASIPNSIRRLKNLTDLYFTCTCTLDLRKRDKNEFLLMLVHHCKSLCNIGEGYLAADGIKLSKELHYVLACNRARFRTGIGDKDKGCPQTTPKLWPRMLNCATRAFDWCSYYHHYHHRQPYIIEKPDAIYQLIVDDRESFVGLLVNRNIKDSSTGTKGT